MAIARTLFQEEHLMFRDAVQRFVKQEIAPFHAGWEKDGIVSREVWLKAGKAGFLCPAVPLEYGGAGGDFLHSVIVHEELVKGGATGTKFELHSDIVAPYILHYGSEPIKKKYLAAMASGTSIGAIAMTEPDCGSDLQAIRTTAVRDGDDYVINGQKTFITNGQLADVIVLAVKTDPAQGARGVSLIVVDGAGVTRGRNLDKLGLKAQDTSELFFSDVRVPAGNLLGEEGRGFSYMMQELPQERLSIGLIAVAASEAALEWTIDYTKSRKAFGTTISQFQNTRFKLAELKTEIQIGRVFVDKCVELHLKGALDADTAAMCKYWLSDLQCRVMDECLQLHGGNGYMLEYPIARAYADARVQRIYGGTNEIMKELISRNIF